MGVPEILLIVACVGIVVSVVVCSIVRKKKHKGGCCGDCSCCSECCHCHDAQAKNKSKNKV